MATRHTLKRGEQLTSTFISAYHIMWILVTFDLPVETKKQRRDACKFRNYLLDQGFEMSQFSNYLRCCNGKDQFGTHIARMERNLPARGHVYVFQFTDKQYENIIRFSDQSRRSRQSKPDQLALF